jgi:hypothetical protein
MVSGAGRIPTRVSAFGTAAFEVAVWIGLVGGLAGACGSGLESHLGDAGSFELLVDVAALLRVEVPGFAHHCFGDAFAELAGGELGVGVRKFKPQRPCRIEPAWRSRGRCGTPTRSVRRCRGDLFRVHIRGELLGHLRLGEADRLGHLQRRGGGPQLFQSGNPVNPCRIRGRTVIGDSFSEVGQHLIQPHQQSIPGRRLDLDLLTYPRHYGSLPTKIEQKFDTCRRDFVGKVNAR